MRTFITTLLIAVSAGLVFVACEDTLTTEPYQSVSPEVALADISGIRNLVLSPYGRLQEPSLYGRTLMLAPEVMADNAESRPGTSRYASQAVNANRAHMGTIWQQGYQLINEANTVLNALDNLDMDAPGVSQAEVDQMAGEMLFLRALTYHDLVRVFGYEPGTSQINDFDLGVVLRTEPTRGAEEADLRSRATVGEVYTQIKDDLQQATSLLDGNDRGEFYGNHAAALALRARVALYERDWSTAADFAQQAMNATDADLVAPSEFAVADLVDPDGGLVSSNMQGITTIYDANPNPESLFEVAYQTQGEYPDNQNASPSSYLLPRQWHANVPTDDFLVLFESGDVRRTLYPHDDVEHGFPYTVKYNESQGEFLDNIPVIRYPELLLISAEAKANDGDVPGGLADLNTLREARNASPVSAGSSAALVDLVLDERRREYGFEGHRFFDLKRLGMGIRKASGQIAVSANDHRILANLPSRDINLNENLVQNPGY